MAVLNATTTRSTPTSKEDRRVPNEAEMSMFNLRDTLSGITVRDANFSEFLAVLKMNGMQAAKPN